MCCNDYSDHLGWTWKFNHNKLENHQGYLKPNDIINLRMNIKKNRYNNKCVTLRSHDIQFTVDKDTFQGVVSLL